MRKAESIFVRNNGEEPFSDRFDGEDFTIEPGHAIEMTIECAKLVFGFGEDDKARAIRRLGYAPTSAEMPAALKRLYAFSFHMDQAEAEKGRSSAPATNRNVAESSGSAADRPSRRRRKYKRRAKRAPAAPPLVTEPSAAQPAAG